MPRLLRGLSATALAVFFNLLVGVPAHSAVPAPAAGERIALVIGNGAYKSAPLANPVNDATDVAAALRKSGFTVTLRTNVNRAQMRAAVRDFGEALRRGQVGLFYFAGHGVESRGKNFLIPLAASMASEFELEDEAMDANAVLRAMEDAGNATNIMILDACRDNPFARSWRNASRGLAQMNAPTGSFIAFATAPGSVASDGTGRNGTFTKHLLTSLNQQDLDIDRVFTRVTAGVAQETGKKQVPWKSSSLTGAFSFGAGEQVASINPQLIAVDPNANDRAYWDSVKDTKNTAELDAYLTRFPNGLFVELAQARLKVLSAPVAPPVQVATVAPNIAATVPQAAAGSLASIGAGRTFRDCAECPEMVVIPPGSFMMGSPASETGRDNDEGPQHSVRISRLFALGRYEVTKGQFARFVSESGYSSGSGCFVWNGSAWNNDASKNWRDPGFAQGDDDPVACVNWNDAKAYVEWLSRKSGKAYRLPTEAEWEYAARAGTTTAFATGDRITPQQANYNTSVSFAGSPTAVSRGRTAPVGSYPANPFGLHDMHGNLWEWTEDCWNGNYNGAPTDGSAWASGDCSQRALRGGSWDDGPQGLRSAYRSRGTATRRYYSGGFRVSRTD